MLTGAITFVCIGLWFVIAPPLIENSYWGNPVKLAIVGAASILFFGICAVALLRKLPDNEPGLVINDQGLIDHSSGLSTGMILWSDMIDISVIEIHTQKLIMLYVKNPEEYISRQTSLFKRKGMELNQKMYGTPLNITTNALRVKFDELMTMLMMKFEEARRKRENGILNTDLLER